MTGPMTDDALIALAEHRFTQADRDGATHDDGRQLRDIFPVVLQRLREKVEITRNLVMIREVDVNDAAAAAPCLIVPEAPRRTTSLNYRCSTCDAVAPLPRPHVRPAVHERRRSPDRGSGMDLCRPFGRPARSHRRMCRQPAYSEHVRQRRLYGDGQMAVGL